MFTILCKKPISTSDTGSPTPGLKTSPVYSFREGEFRMSSGLSALFAIALNSHLCLSNFSAILVLTK